MADELEQSSMNAAKSFTAAKMPSDFIPDERWNDYVDFLPGFAGLERSAAVEAYNRLGAISYHPAKKILYKDESRKEVKDIYLVPSIGFLHVELAQGSAHILISRELNRAFVYSNDAKSSQAAKEIAETLLSKDGHDPITPVELRQLPEDGELPFYELGKEIEEAHRRVRLAEYESMAEKVPGPWFVAELKTYYSGREESHAEAVQRALNLRDMTLRDEEADSRRICGYIRVYLDACSKYNLTKLNLEKVKPPAYDDVYDSLTNILEAKGDNVIPFRRKYSTRRATPLVEEKVPPVQGSEERPLNSPVEQATPEEVLSETHNTPTNLGYVLDHVQKQLATQQELLQRHQDRLDQGILTLPNGHHEVFQRYLRVYKDLKFLRKNGIEWVGDDSDLPEEKLFSNIRKIRTEVEKDQTLLPQVGTLEFYEHLQKIIDQDETGQAEPTIPAVPPLDEKKTAEVAPPNPIPTEEHPKSTAPKPPITPAKPVPACEPAVKTEWRRTKAIFSWVKKNAPALVVGGLTGAAVRIGAQFALVALVTTTPGVLATIGSAVFIGAVAGGVSKVVTTSLFGGAKKDEKNWKRKAFWQGAAIGAVGAGIGAGVAQWLISHDYLPVLGEHYDAPAAQTHVPAAPSPDHPVTVPSDTSPAPLGADAPAPAPDTTPSHTPEQPVTPHADQPSAPPQTDPPPPTGVTQPVAPQGNVKDLLTEEQFKKLPRRVRSLAFSHDPKEIARFCKEASFSLINGSPHNPEAMKAGAKLIEHGLDTAKASGLHNIVTDKLHADFAYLKAWGIGTDKNTGLAIEHARQSGTVIRNYGARLLSLLHAPKVG